MLQYLLNLFQQFYGTVISLKIPVLIYSISVISPNFLHYKSLFSCMASLVILTKMQETPFTIVCIKLTSIVLGLHIIKVHNC